MFRALYGHLTRLGWRSENESDRAREREQDLRNGVAVLREIEALESRPPETPGAWAEAVRRWPQGQVRLHLSGTLERMSAEEREVATGGARRRLRALATSGRIEQEQFDALMRRLAHW